jgi:hypothetical protein
VLEMVEPPRSSQRSYSTSKAGVENCVRSLRNYSSLSTGTRANLFASSSRRSWQYSRKALGLTALDPRGVKAFVNVAWIPPCHAVDAT